MPTIDEKPSRVISGMKLYDTEKLSKILGTDINTIRRFFREEIFPKVRLNRRYYLSEQDLLKYLTTGKISLEKAQEIDKEVIKRTEENLEIIAKKLQRMKFMVDKLEKFKGYSNIFLEVEKYEEKYIKLKKELEESKKEPITEKDL
ncbi:hypothetical protein ES705_32245 [subsurface metagenome]|nr:helix-turn-helix domain-containing protein [Clostridia bacterium]